MLEGAAASLLANYLKCAKMYRDVGKQDQSIRRSSDLVLRLWRNKMNAKASKLTRQVARVCRALRGDLRKVEYQHCSRHHVHGRSNMREGWLHPPRRDAVRTSAGNSGNPAGVWLLNASVDQDDNLAVPGEGLRKAPRSFSAHEKARHELASKRTSRGIRRPSLRSR